MSLPLSERMKLENKSKTELINFIELLLENKARDYKLINANATTESD